MPTRKPFTENLAPEELDANAAQVQRDLAEGNGAKHFEDLLDDVFSSESRAKNTNAPDADARFEQDRYYEQLRRQLKRDVNEHTVSHGMRATQVIVDNAGDCMVILQDANGREFSAQVSFNETNLPIEVGGREVYKLIVDSIVERALASRKAYFDRMCVTVEGSMPDKKVLDYKPTVVGYCEDHNMKATETLRGISTLPPCKICGKPSVRAEWANGDRIPMLLETLG